MKKFLEIPIERNRIFGLDVLRAAAILFVSIGHSTFLLPGNPRKFIELFIFDGVTIFFVLSGFLIGQILLKTFSNPNFSKKNILNFWIRRWFRTLPNYFLILIILTILHVTFSKDVDFKEVIRYFFFSQNLLHVLPYWFFPESWSLTIEEWFYILLPIFLIVFLKIFKISLKKSVVVIIFSFILGEIVLRFILLKIFQSDSHEFFKSDYIFKKQIVTRFDSLMFGFLGAYFNVFRQEIWLKYKKIALFSGLFLLIIDRIIINSTENFANLYFTVFSLSTISLGTFLLLPFLSNFQISKGFLYKKITEISIISYSMYLLNLSIIQKWIINSISWKNFGLNNNTITLLQYFMYWFLLFFLSIILYKYFESKMTKLRDSLKIRQFLNRFE